MRSPNRDITRRTSRAVYLWDKAAGGVITIGGATVLAAVLGICLYLFWTVLPLFKGGSAVQRPPTSASAAAAAPSTPLLTIAGDNADSALFLDQDGTARAVSLKSGAEFLHAPIADGKTITATSRPEHGGLVAIGLADGSLRLGTLTLSSHLLRDNELTPAIKAIALGAQSAIPGESGPRLIEHTQPDQFRATEPVISLRETIPPGQAPLARIDLRESAEGGRFVVGLRTDGSAFFGTVTTTTPLGGGDPTDRVTSNPFTLAPASLASAAKTPDYLFVTSDGRHILALWKVGALQRYTTGVGSDAGVAVTLAEELNIAEGSPITAAGLLLGGQTLVIGTSSGKVLAYETARDVTANTPDAMHVVQSAQFEAGPKAVTSLAMAERDRIVAAGCEDGSVILRHMTSRKTIAQVPAASTPPSTNDAPRAALALTAKCDALLAIDPAGHSRVWDLSLGHADASVASLFTPLIYEGEAKPRFIYQSSSGSDAAEVKLSLVPLIFGTLKATVVGMLVAVPLAVLGAIYSSEFMHKRVRKVVKPTVEMMASLPSVVLGFVAAMVVAPYMRDWLPRVLVGILLTPVFLVFFAYLWQLVPRDTAARITRRARFLLVGFALAVSMLLAAGLGPTVERTLFRPTHQDALVAAGSFKPLPKDQWPAWVGQRQTMSPDEERLLRQRGLYFRDSQVVQPVEASVPEGAAGAPGIQRWLDGSIGTALPGWIAALFLPVLLILSFAQARFIDREKFEELLGATRAALAAAELLRFALVIAVGLGLTIALAWAFTLFGWDTRDSIFGPYSQRNSLVVGVIMGFAVIPLVFTISEDALRSVPNSLRSASLGVGATPWQTALRVVLPAAGSGVFSAIMIGLGRAVGETMIVLMAAGNTPEISSNIFSGFRTLAANIAVELPEAVNGSSHARVLFLCGLILFAMTFVINTTAEVVRQRFRKRNAAL